MQHQHFKKQKFGHIENDITSTKFNTSNESIIIRSFCRLHDFQERFFDNKQTTYLGKILCMDMNLVIFSDKYDERGTLLVRNNCNNKYPLCSGDKNASPDCFPRKMSLENNQKNI